MGCGGHEEHADDWIDTTDACAASAKYCCQEKGCFPEGSPYDGSVECCEGLVVVDGHCATPTDPGVCTTVDVGPGKCTGRARLDRIWGDYCEQIYLDGCDYSNCTRKNCGVVSMGEECQAAGLSLESALCFDLVEGAQQQDFAIYMDCMPQDSVDQVLASYMSLSDFVVLSSYAPPDQCPPDPSGVPRYEYLYISGYDVWAKASFPMDPSVCYDGGQANAAVLAVCQDQGFQSAWTFYGPECPVSGAMGMTIEICFDSSCTPICCSTPSCEADQETCAMVAWDENGCLMYECCDMATEHCGRDGCEPNCPAVPTCEDGLPACATGAIEGPYNCPVYECCPTGAICVEGQGCVLPPTCIEFLVGGEECWSVEQAQTTAQEMTCSGTAFGECDYSSCTRQSCELVSLGAECTLATGFTVEAVRCVNFLSPDYLSREIVLDRCMTYEEVDALVAEQIMSLPDFWLDWWDVSADDCVWPTYRRLLYWGYAVERRTFQADASVCYARFRDGSSSSGSWYDMAVALCQQNGFADVDLDGAIEGPDCTIPGVLGANVKVCHECGCTPTCCQPFTCEEGLLTCDTGSRDGSIIHCPIYECCDPATHHCGEYGCQENCPQPMACDDGQPACQLGGTDGNGCPIYQCCAAGATCVPGQGCECPPMAACATFEECLVACDEWANCKGTCGTYRPVCLGQEVEVCGRDGCYWVCDGLEEYQCVLGCR